VSTRQEGAGPLAEVDLELVARLTIRDAHRAATPAPADVADLQRVAVQGPLRDHHASAGEELTRLADRQTVLLEPRHDPIAA
jgi:hypothetical protein